MNKMNQATGGSANKNVNDFSGKSVAPSPMGKLVGHEDAKSRKKVTKND